MLAILICDGVEEIFTVIEIGREIPSAYIRVYPQPLDWFKVLGVTHGYGHFPIHIEVTESTNYDSQEQTTMFALICASIVIYWYSNRDVSGHLRDVF